MLRCTAMVQKKMIHKFGFEEDEEWSDDDCDCDCEYDDSEDE